MNVNGGTCTTTVKLPATPVLEGGRPRERRGHHMTEEYADYLPEGVARGSRASTSRPSRAPARRLPGRTCQTTPRYEGPRRCSAREGALALSWDGRLLGGA